MFHQGSEQQRRDVYYHAANGVEVHKPSYGNTSAASMQSPGQRPLHYLSHGRPSPHDLYGPNGLTLASYSRSATSSPASMDEASSGPEFDDEEDQEFDDELGSMAGSGPSGPERTKMKRFRCI